ncbi:MAG: polysaccharide deacetylase family protein, partial [Pseudomonadota bacterium]
SALRFLPVVLACMVLSACNTTKTPPPSSTAFAKAPVRVAAPVGDAVKGGEPLRAAAGKQARAINFATSPVPKAPSRSNRKGSTEPEALRGRTLYASSSRIPLRNKEVVLTFDDGPHPTHTPRILAALDKYGVKATFFMLGETAKRNSALARRVASRGHTVAHHTWGHPNLRKLGRSAAMAEVRKGRAAVKAVVGPGQTSRFFRFPYLADSQALRESVRGDGDIIIDVDVDSKDYFKTDGDTVRQRTMARLRKRGKGVILLHDIHGRTASMLPKLLADLKRDGYKVVTLRSSDSPSPDLIASR